MGSQIQSAENRATLILSITLGTVGFIALILFLTAALFSGGLIMGSGLGCAMGGVCMMMTPFFMVPLLLIRR